MDQLFNSSEKRLARVLLLMANFGKEGKPLPVIARNWYGGFGIGSSKAKIDDARITSGLLGGGLATTAITNDDRHTAYKL